MSISISVEHPYAQLQSVQKTEASQVNRYECLLFIYFFFPINGPCYLLLICRRNNVNQAANIEKPSTSAIGQSSGNPIAPPRTRRSSSHNSLLSSDSHCDIQAANAISGGVQANQDLPYMTPPLLMLLPHPPQPQHSPQQHFSGDSQDSSNYFSTYERSLVSFISCVNNNFVCKTHHYLILFCFFPSM